MKPNSPLKPPASQYVATIMVAVESKPFVEFDRWMDVQLGELVSRWSHMAAPRALRAERILRRFGR
jgi:hypothetical protein